MFRNPMPIYKQFIILEFLGNATLQEEEKEICEKNTVNSDGDSWQCTH